MLVTGHRIGESLSKDQAALTRCWVDIRDSNQELSSTLEQKHVSPDLIEAMLVAAVLLPLNLVVGLMGSNVGGVPGSGHDFGFAVLIGVIVLLGLGGWLAFRRYK